ncbi:p51 [Dikerogammarus haemobaphes nudivirus]|nr:p51 [Dikerogammarus haemobaphes nudivirus]
MLFPETIIQEFKNSEYLKLKTGVIHKLDKNNEFIYNDARYVIYKNYTSMRNHHTPFDFETKIFPLPLIIQHSAAIELIQYIINLSKNIVIFVDTSGNVLYTKEWQLAFTDLVNDLKKLVEEHKTQEHNAILKALDVLSSNLDFKDVEKGILSSKITPIKITLNTTQSVSSILENLLEYMVNYTTFDDSTINNRLLNSSMDRIYAVISILSFYNSTLVLNDIYSDKTTLIAHRMCEILYDALIDRTTNELFIKKRNIHAAHIRHQFECRFPFLKNSNVAAIKSEIGNSNLLQVLEQEPLDLYPYVMLFHTSNMDRLKELHEFFTTNKDFMKNYTASAFNWPNFTEYIGIINSFITAYNTFIMYDVNNLVLILPKIINVEDVNSPPEDFDIAAMEE